MSLSRSRRPQAPSIKKHRCWTFLVGGVKRNGIVSGNEARIFAAFRAKYTAAKRLSITVTRDKRRAGGAKGNGKASKVLSVEVQFTGPQPSEGPGLLLRDLLSGGSVEARPVNLGRGRKKKYARVPTATKASVVSVVDEPKKNGRIDATRGGEASSLVPVSVSDNECNKGDVDVTGPNAVDVITPGDLALPAWHRSGIEALATRESKCDRPVMMALSQPPVGLTEAMDQTSSALTLGPESLRQLDDVWSCFENPQASPRDCVSQTMAVDGNAFDLLTITDDEKDDCGLAWRGSLTSSGSDDYDPLSDASELLRTAWLLDSNYVSEGSNRYGESWTQNTLTVDENTANPMGSGQVTRMDDSGADSQDDSDLNGDERYPEVELLHKVCDFEGRPSLDGGSRAPMAAEPPCGGRSHLLLKGIKATGRGGCEMPSISAFFSAGPSHKTGRIICPVKVDDDGVIQAAVFYPSMQVLWPDVYAAKNVQEVEVDVAVDLRWGDEEINCAGPSLKVTYRRPPVRATEATAASMVVCRRMSPTPNDVAAEGGPMRDDYYDGDFFM